MHTMVGNLRVLLGARDEPGPGERELLGAFLARRDAKALEELIRRHGPMALGACRRVLGDGEGADDAFLVAFVALARRADTVRPTDALAGWLHGVAVAAARQKRARAETIVFVRREASAESIWLRLAPLLDEEVARLPWKQRAAVILCDLEGRTRKEAAGLLGWPEKATAGRLSEARSRLAAGLRRRGLDLSTADLAVALAQNVAWGVSATCLRQTAAAALSPPAEMARLADGAVVAARPRRPRWKLAAVGALMAAAGLALLLALWPTPSPPEPEKPRPAESAQAPAMRHPGVTRLAVSGARVASSSDGEVRLWNASTGELIRRLAGLRGTVVALQFVRGGEALLVADKSGVRLWDVEAGRKTLGPRPTPGEAEVVTASPDGALIAWGGRSGVVHVWDVKQGKELRSFQGPSYMVLGLAFGPDGLSLAVAGGDNTSRLIDVGTGREQLPAYDHKAIQTCVAVSPGGAVYAAGGHGGVALREAGSGQILKRLDHPAAVRSVAFSGDGNYLATWADDGEARVWEVATGRLCRRLPLDGGVVAFSPDGEQVVWVARGVVRVSPLGH